MMFADTKEAPDKEISSDDHRTECIIIISVDAKTRLKYRIFLRIILKRLAQQRLAAVYSAR